MSSVVKVMLVVLGAGLALLVIVIRLVWKGVAPGVKAHLSKIRADWLVCWEKPAYTALMRTARHFEDAARVDPEPGGANDWDNTDAGWAEQYYKNALDACNPEGRSAVDRATAEAGLARVKLFRAQLGQVPLVSLWEAIKYSRQALKTYTFDLTPEAWGGAQVTLAAALCERNTSSHRDTEQAIGLCEQVLERLGGRSDMYPLLCGQAHYVKAEALFKQHNLQLAERHYQDAVALLESADDRRYLARALCGLGWTYLEMVYSTGQELDRAFTAIVGSERRLLATRWLVLIPPVIESKNPETIAQLERLREEGKALLERVNEAEKCFRRAVRSVSVAEAPSELSSAHGGIADVAEFRLQLPPELVPAIRPRPAELALKRKLAEVGANPRQARQATMKLGDLHFRRKVWDQALRAYKRAMDTDQRLFYFSVTGQDRRALAGQGEPAYRHAAFCQIEMEEFEAALLTLDRGKARVLSERLNRDQAQWDLIKDHEDQQRYETAFREYNQKVQRLEAALETPETEQGDELRESVEKAREQLGEIERKLRNDYSGFLAGLSGDDLSQLTADDKMAIVVPLLTRMGGVVILVIQGKVKVVPLSDFDLRAVEALAWKIEDSVKEKVERWLDAYAAPELHDGGWSVVLAEIAASDGDGMADKLGWVPAYRLHYASRRHQDAWEITRRWWHGVMQRVLEDLYEQFWLPVLAELPPQVDQLVIVPQGVLHLIPLGAASKKRGGKAILERYTVSYAPSLNVLQKCLRAAEDMVAVTSPTLLAAVGSQAAGRLLYAESEVDAIAGMWEEQVGSQPTLLKDDATEEAFLRGAMDAVYIHYTGHAKYEWGDPAKSGLLVEDKEVEDDDKALTVKEIEDKGALQKSRLVVLSACETGLVDMATAPEEYVGLPAAFLVAGVPCVVSSLWPVEDLSTALLMTRFYYEHLKEGLSPGRALQAAQRWLRHATREELGEYGESFLTYDISLEITLGGEPEDRPYIDKPYFWAAFTFTGTL